VPSHWAAPEPRFDADVRRDVRIPTAEAGVTLSADVYRPAVDHPVPVLVTVQPYRKDFVAGAGYEGPARWFAERGYAGLVVDLLGTGSSDGVRRPEFDPGDADDAIAAIEWAAGQPWCTGAVGMWGLSYAGNTTLRTASRQPPRLRAIIALAHGLDPARDSVHPDGARGDLHALANRGTALLLQQLLPPLSDYASPVSRRRWQHRLRDGEPVFLDYARHGPHDPVWRERAVDGTAIVVPSLCVGGWRDAFPEGLIDAYERISGPKKLIMGPWGHVLPQDSAYEPIDFLSVALRWWEHWLLGADTGLMDDPAVTLFLPGAPPQWRGYQSWPPAAAELVLATRGDRTLAPPNGRPDPQTAPIARHRPDATVGALRGLPGLGMGEEFPPLDQHDDDMRSVSVTSEPLAEGVTIGGRPRVRVILSGAGTGPVGQVGRLVVRLTEVDADGRSTLISAGVACPLRAGPEHVVTLRPIVHRVGAGRRLRVAVGDADFPRLVPLVEPTPFELAGIEARIPTLAEASGTPVDVPALRPGPDRAPNAGWRVTRDHVHGQIEVVVTGEAADQLGREGHRYGVSSELHATVRQTAPETAVTSGTQTAEVRMSTGELVTAAATVRCTQTALWARGEVTADGFVLFSKTWEADLVPDSAWSRTGGLARRH
jgi:uncharacterized protein